MNKYFITFLLTIMVIGQCFAQSSYRYDIIDVEQLRLKADSVAKINLEIEPDFYGYSAVLHTSNEGKLTTLTYPLDATFRYALPKGLGAEGAGIAVILDAHMQPSLQMGQFSVEKLPLKGKYADLGQAIQLFTQFYPAHEDLTSVTLFHDASMDEPVYLFGVEEGIFVLGAVSGGYNIIER